MSPITATNKTTTTSTNTQVMPALFPRTDRERFEQTADQLQGFAELAATWRNVQRIAGMVTPTKANDGIEEYVFALDKQFAQAFIKAFPTVEFVQDVLLQGGLDAMHEARAESEPAPATMVGAEPDESPTTPNTNPMWKAMLDAHNGDMRGAMTEAGYGDAGTATTEDAMQTVTCWAMRLASIDRLGILIELARTFYAQGRADGREPHEVK